MIRPLTIVTCLMACGSGLYLYQSKHEVQLLDRTIERTVHDTEALREQSRLLAAEWTMLNDPERLRQFSDTYLSLKTISPSQFTSLADLDSRLPAVQPRGAGACRTNRDRWRRQPIPPTQLIQRRPPMRRRLLLPRSSRTICRFLPFPPRRGRLPSRRRPVRLGPGPVDRSPAARRGGCGQSASHRRGRRCPRRLTSGRPSNVCQSSGPPSSVRMISALRETAYRRARGGCAQGRPDAGRPCRPRPIVLAAPRPAAPANGAGRVDRLRSHRRRAPMVAASAAIRWLAAWHGARIDAAGAAADPGERHRITPTERAA